MHTTANDDPRATQHHNQLAPQATDRPSNPLPRSGPPWPLWRRRAHHLLLALGCALPWGSQAQTLPVAPAPTAEIAARLQALYPATRFGEVSPTPWPGLYEVPMGANLAYVDASGRYFLFGHLYDMQQQQDLTAQRKELLSRVDFSALPLADALTEVRGNGARVLAIFSDPDCPYCRRLEADLQGLTDVTLHTFLMPLATLHPRAHAKAVSVWCADDRLQTWKGLMLREQTPTTAACDHPVDRNIALGEKLGIQGTPTLIAADGRMMPGAASRAQIEAWLSRSSISAHVQPSAPVPSAIEPSAPVPAAKPANPTNPAKGTQP